MTTYHRVATSEGRERVETTLRGVELLRQPLLNRGSAFSHEERRALGLEGLLPAVVSSQDRQAERVYAQIARKTDPLERYVGLAALQDRNEYLFYRLLLDHLEELLPIVYTPTVGQASKKFSHIFRRGRGVWVTPEHRGRVREVLAAAPHDQVRLVVATDNQAILGIGDQGAGGMAIPIGKLAIYCGAAGIHPAETLPVSLDVGTDNRDLLDDDLYMGWRQPRLRGDDYDELVDELVTALAELFPGVLLQWEDFRKVNAFTLLERYRERILSFNDDVQGTGATALAGLLAAGRISGSPLTGQRVVIVGGGAAGMGIAHQLRTALAAAGLAGDDLTRAVAVLDSRGLLVDDRERLDPFKRRWAWPTALAASHGLGEARDLEAVVARLEPTALIGTSGQPGLFTEDLVRQVAARVERPVIFPFSNPTSLAEARPEDVYRWTEGRALVAAGSPFAPVVEGGREHRVGQGNNALIFPAVGLGALAGGARTISDEVFTTAAKALAGAVSEDELAHGQLYPSIDRLREVTVEIAAAVVRQVAAERGEEMATGVARGTIEQAMWTPDYPEIIPVLP